MSLLIKADLTWRIRLIRRTEIDLWGKNLIWSQYQDFLWVYFSRQNVRCNVFFGPGVIWLSSRTFSLIPISLRQIHGFSCHGDWLKYVIMKRSGADACEQAILKSRGFEKWQMRAITEFLIITSQVFNCEAKNKFASKICLLFKLRQFKNSTQNIQKMIYVLMNCHSPSNNKQALILYLPPYLKSFQLDLNQVNLKFMEYCFSNRFLYNSHLPFSLTGNL